MTNKIKHFFSILLKFHKETILNFTVIILLTISAATSLDSLSRAEATAICLLLAYIAYCLWDSFKVYQATAAPIQSAYSVCLNQPIANHHDNIRQQIETLNNRKIGISRVINYFKVKDFDWQYYNQSKSSPRLWEHTIKEIGTHFTRYVNLFPIKTNHNIFLQLPAIMSLGLGFTIGKQRDWTIYNFENSAYIPLEKPIDVKKPKAFDLITIDKKTNELPMTDSFDLLSQGSDISVILLFTALPKDNYPPQNRDTRYIRQKNSLERIPSQSFYQVAKEISTYITDLLIAGHQIHLYPGLPVTLAFILGMYLDGNSAITVYNRNSETSDWESVLYLDNIESNEIGL